MTTVSIDTTVEVDLYKISTEDLIDELSHRSWDELAKVPVNQLIRALGDMGCPRWLIDQLREWEGAPVATKEALKKWVSLSK